MRYLYRLLGVIAISGLAGCMSSEMQQQRFNAAKVPSPQIKQSLLNAARDYLFDPGSIRDAEISNVFVWNDIQDTKAVCVKFNSKNRLGGYTGRSTNLVQISKDNKILGAIDNWPGCYNSALKWHQFPEANGLKSL